MKSVGSGERFDERGHRKRGSKAEWKVFSLGNCMADGAAEAGNTEGQTLVKVLMTC